MGSVNANRRRFQPVKEAALMSLHRFRDSVEDAEVTAGNYVAWQAAHPDESPLSLVRQCFGGWPAARMALGLSRGPGRSVKGDSARALRDVRRAARMCANEILSERDYEALASRHGLTSMSTLRSLYGSFGDASQLAGVRNSRVGRVLAGAEVEAQLQKVWVEAQLRRSKNAGANGGAVEGPLKESEYVRIREDWTRGRGTGTLLPSSQRIIAAYNGWRTALNSAGILVD